MRRFVAVLLLLAASALPAGALTFPPSLRDDLRKSGRIDEVSALLASARARGVAGYDAGVRSLGPAFNANGRMPDRAVVLLVDFADQPARRATFTREWYRRLFFGLGESETGSFREYYREISYGAYDVNGAFGGWYTAPQPLAFYTGGASGIGVYPQNAQRLVEDALRAADDDVNFAHFDNDGPDGLPDSGDDDGFVDAVVVVHAGPAAETTGSKGDIWSHEWVVHEPVDLDGVHAGFYITVAEDARIGVICHEFGHILRLEDLYDTDFDGAGLGLWSIMAYGASSAAGVKPPHPDAWSRARLGFATPIVPSENLAGVQIPPIETAPVIYKLWTYGAGASEYFLVENRQKLGFDSSLPAEGLLIYHVDEGVPSNLDEDHYRVGVEQSDAQKHLELGFWFGNLGDAGDPYPGVQHRTEFSVVTTPSSRSYNDVRTSVAVRNIRAAGTSIEADLYSFPAPVAEPRAIVLQDAGGDGCLAAGESGSLAALVKSSGESGGPFELELASLSPALAIDPAGVEIASLPAGPAEVQSPWIAARAEDGATGAAPVRAVLSAAGVTIADEVFTVALEAAPARTEHLDDRDGWTTAPAAGNGAWGRAPDRAAWRVGGAYAGYLESILTSPVFAARPGAVLRFSYRCALPGAEEQAPDGVEVEGSLNGGAWVPLVPVAAVEYPVPANPALALGGRQALSDTTSEWTRAIFSLGEGGAWSVRFLFGSDSVVNGGFFELDSLASGTSFTPIAPSAACRRTGGGVRLTVSVAESDAYLGAAFLRSRDGGPFARLHDGWIRLAGGNAAFDDAGVSGRLSYRIDLLRRTGEIESLGPFTPAGPGPPGLALLSANPFNEGVRLAFSVPPGSGPYAIRVFDLAGRRVAEIAAGTDTAGERAEALWDGRDGRGPAAAGIYFVRLEHGGGAKTVRTVRLR